MPYFDDNLFAGADAVLDSIFAGPAIFRVQGVALSLNWASVRSHAVGTDGDKTAAQTWIGFVVEVHVSDLVVNGQTVHLQGGEEIAFPLSAGGQKVYVVVVGPNGRVYEPLDTEDLKWLVFCKYDHQE
jgi:hypothetical protein